jgi:hypothetical protein
VIAQDAQDDATTRVGEGLQHGVHGLNVPALLRTRKGNFIRLAR